MATEYPTREKLQLFQNVDQVVAISQDRIFNISKSAGDAGGVVNSL